MARTKNRFNAVNRESEDIKPVQKEWRTALYARLSVELVDRKSESIENQLELMRKFTEGKPEFAEISEYTDKGFSGTDFHRPAFENMMDDVRSGKINCIIVKDLSRLGRDYLETSNFVETIFPFLGVRFIAVNDHFDTSEKHNGNKEMEIALKNLVNDMYARDISKRMVTSRKQEQISGKFLGSNAPYGYKREENHPLRRLIIDEPAAEVVRSIYGMVLDGLTLREISLKLQEKRFSIPGQYLKNGHLHYEPGDEVKKWYIGTVSGILHNQAYIGNLVQGRRKTRHYKGEERHFTDREEWIIIEGTHEPIVSKEVFEEVQKRLSHKVENSGFASERTKDIPIRPNRFRGILYCGICGEKLSYHSVVPKEDGAERRYYLYCSESYDLNIRKHTGIYISEEVLEEILKDMIGELVRHFEEADHEVTTLMEKELKAGMAGMKRDIHKAECRLTNLDAVSAARYEAYVLGTITKEEFLTGRSTDEEQREKAEQELAGLQEKCTGYEACTREKMRWLLGLNRASTGELDSDLLHLLIKRIELHPKHELRITWRFTENDILGKDGE